MRIVSVVGARPQFVKLAPIAAAASARGVDHVIVHTGQHYDEMMSDRIFTDLEIPAPDVNLAIGSGKHGAQTGAMLAAVEPVLLDARPDWVLVYGDTNSTLAAAVASVKLGLPLAHLEAGLRSYNRRMPEEHNRVLTDHAADLCLAPTQNAVTTLEGEGLAARTKLVGDVMVDVFNRMVTQTGKEFAEVEPFVLATIHRAENTDDPRRLRAIIDALASLPLNVRLPAHPRLVSRCHHAGIDLNQGSLRPVDPLGYRDLVAALTSAHAVVTDSGGVQKEAFIAGVPTSTLRSETEWVETLHGDWNVLVSNPTELATVVGRPFPTADRGHPFGTGNAACLVLESLETAGAAAREDLQ
ncbi:MAG: non-hydrolyzing UDP-N-acetylglucosamine 2-epimerase [Marmoricola sp.]